MCVLCLQCKVVPRARLTACVICVTASMARWQRRTCSVGAVRRGQGYFEHCSDSLTSTMPSSTCTLPSCALLWVICEFARLSAGVCACQHVCYLSLSQSTPTILYKKLCEFFCIFLPSCASVETTCSTSVNSSSRSAALKATTSSSRTTQSLVRMEQ